MRAPHKTGPLRAETGKRKKGDEPPVLFAGGAGTGNSPPPTRARTGPTAPPFYHPGLGRHVSADDPEWFRALPDAPLRPVARARTDAATPAIPMTGFFSPDTDDALIDAPPRPVCLSSATPGERIVATHDLESVARVLNDGHGITIDAQRCFGLFLMHISDANKAARERTETFAKKVDPKTWFSAFGMNDNKPMTPLDIVLLRSHEITGIADLVRVLYSLDFAAITIDVKKIEDVDARTMARMILKGGVALFF